MRCLFFVMLFPFYGFSQSYLFTYYDKVEVIKEGIPLKMPWAGGFNAVQINLANLDGDTGDEIILMDRNSATLKIFSYNDGTYSYRPDLLQYLPPINLDWIIFADYNCDGKKDIFNYGQTGVIVYKNVSNESSFATWEKVADPLFTTGFTGKINLFVNPADVPAIQDIDGDGDLDILSYNFATGEDIRFHKNYAMENGDCEDFDFVIEDRQWGAFKECSCFEYAFNGQTCADVINGRVAHTGGKSLTAYDIDNDGDQDLFLGHDDCANLIFLENIGDQENALFTDFSSTYPQSDPAAIALYPTIQFLDIDFDGKKELIASPNVDVNLSFTSDFANSLWIYENIAASGPPDFSLSAKNLLQNEMLDFGEMSAPVFFDIDGDGDKDLLVAVNGKNIGGIHYGRVVLLENTGTSFNPSYEVKEDDFLELSSLQLHIPRLRFADFNRDGKADLFFAGYSTNEGKMKSFVLPNTSAGTAPPQFDPASPIEVNAPLRIFENPEFFDTDGDGDPDLLVGMRNGSLTLYENTGSNVFQLKENDYQGIGRDFSLEKVNLFVTVYDLDNDGKKDLITADRKELSVYYDFLNSDSDPQMLLAFNDETQSEEPIKTENYNWVSFSDIFGSGYGAMVAGGSGGGLKFFRNKNEVVNPDEVPLNVKVYPNPAATVSGIFIEANKTGTVIIYNLWGQRVSSREGIMAGVKNKISLPLLAQGVYILTFETPQKERLNKKLIIK